MSNEVIILVVTAVLVAIIGMLIGTFITKLYAGKKGWDKSIGSAAKLNLIWFVINLATGLIVTYVLGSNVYIGYVVELIIDIILGGMIASKLYKKKVSESFRFVIAVLIIQVILAIIMGLFISLILGLILSTGI